MKQNQTKTKTTLEQFLKEQFIHHVHQNLPVGFKATHTPGLHPKFTGSGSPGVGPRNLYVYKQLTHCTKFKIFRAITSR